MKKREGTLIGLLLTLAVIYSGCRNKPAYNDIDANRTSRTQNQNGETQPAIAPSGQGEPVTVAPTPPSPPPPQRPGFKSPSFLDQATGEIKDLPYYPRAVRVNAQIGPMQGVNMASFVFQTRDPMDKVTAFYEQAIKKNHWTVIEKKIDPELSEWNLQKGEDGAKVQVKKDPQTGALNIMLVRGEKLVEQNK